MTIKFWYSEKENEAHDLIIKMIDETRATQSYIYQRYLTNTRYYLDRNLTGFEPGSWNPDADQVGLYFNSTGLINVDALPETKDMAWNIIRSNVDTILSSTCHYMPDVRFLPNSASRQTANKTSQLEKYTRGVKQRNKALKLSRAARKDAAICGVGYLKFYVQDNEVRIERVHPDYMTVPEHSTLQGTPTWMAQHYWLSPDTLQSFCIEFGGERGNQIADEIDIAPGYDMAVVGDLVKVYEIWSLPAPGRKGRHVICTDQFTLLDEEWKEEWFPFVVTRWEDSILGQHGSSHIDGLIPLQEELNYMLRKKAEHMAVISHAYVSMKAGDKTTKEKLQDFPWFSIFESVSPGDINFNIPAGDHPSWNSWIQDLYNKSFELKGHSPEMAQGRKEAGLTSGIAIRLSKDIQTQRHSEFTQGWEALHKEMTTLIIKMSKHHEGDLVVKTASQKLIETIKWSEINVEEDTYDVTIDAANPLSQTASGRIDTIIELSQAVQMPPEVLLGMIQHPDIDEYLKHQSAPRNAVKSFIERCLEDMKVRDIPKFLNLDMLVQLGTQYYSDLLDNDAEEEEILIVETILEEALAILNPPPPPVEEMPPEAPQEALPPEGMPPMPPPPLMPPGAPQMGPDGLLVPPPGMEDQVGPPPIPEPLPNGGPAVGEGVPVELPLPPLPLPEEQ